MAPELTPHLNFEQLQTAYLELCVAHEALKLEKQQQETSTDRWLQQRTRELEAEALEQKKAETLQRVFYRIAERAAADLSFYDFLQSVHGLLGELLYARNCYVCLYDAARHCKDFPYYVDERDGDALQLCNVPYRRGLTEFVLRTATPQIIDAARLETLRSNGEVTEGSGDMTFTTWLGVPMHIRGSVSGVLVVQGYEPGVKYSETDADILSFVANHVSSAIERYQALDELRKSEERYRTVIEKVGVGVVVVQQDRMVFANPSFVRIVGHSLDYLMSQPFTAAVHPDDVAVMMARHEKRLRGEPVDEMYAFRVVTATGDIRSLELSAVKIEWGKRAATLIFAVDATARLQAEKTMLSTLQKQSELNAMKSRFIAVASHEFRTPLAFILSSAELLKYYSDRLPVSEKEDIIDTIERGVHRMTGMLDRVLLLGKVDAQMLEFKPAELALHPLINSLVEEICSQFPQRMCSVTVDLAEMPSTGFYDEKLLRHILGNLLSNAVKYSPQGGTVLFRAQAADNLLKFEVTDQGIGIAAEELPQLFEWFHRAGNVGDIPGTGLGLAIVKNSVDLHGGTIKVASTQGQGSCFTVWL